MRSTASRPTISPSPSVLDRGQARHGRTMPGWQLRHLRRPPLGGSAARPRATTSSMWKRPSAATSAMSPSAREKASSPTRKMERQRRSILSRGQAADFRYNKQIRKEERAMSKDVYESPLSSRYASPYMLHLFSAGYALSDVAAAVGRAGPRGARAGPAHHRRSRSTELEAHITDIDYAVAEQREKRGAPRCDGARLRLRQGRARPPPGIIHLGATSCYVTDNADLILYRDGLRYLRGELLGRAGRISPRLPTRIRRHAHPRLHALSARAACDRRQARGALDAGSSAAILRSCDHVLRAMPLPRLPRHDRHGGQLHGAL